MHVNILLCAGSHLCQVHIGSCYSHHLKTRSQISIDDDKKEWLMIVIIFVRRAVGFDIPLNRHEQVLISGCSIAVQNQSL